MDDKFLFENCDYRVLLKRLKRANTLLDAVITDPPYCVSRKHQLGFSNMGRNGMNYGDWDYDFDQREWLRLCCPLVKPGGSVLVFNDWKNFSHISEELDKQKFQMKDVIRWEKSNPMPRNTGRRYVSDFEMAVWAVKDGGQWTFNKPEGAPYLRPTYKYPRVAGKERIHPTQKPLALMEALLLVHTDPGDFVLDPFAGSGTTAVACLKNNRNFVGSELDADYYKKAIKRIKCFIPQ